MQAQIDSVLKRYDEIAHRLCEPQVLADVAQYRALTRESKELEPVVAAASAYRDAQKAIVDAQALLRDPAIDDEMRLLAQQELADNQARAQALSEQIRRRLLPRDPNDNRSVIMEIRGGAGGEESALFAAELYRMYSMYAEAHGWQVEIVSQNPTPLGGLKEISFMVAGDGAYSRLKYESGGHRVQRVPETESGGRIHTSAATVAVLPEAEEVEVTINPADLKIDTYRSSGAGGQHINKTDSAIRITHLPTGLVVECQDERSQFKNKDKAMRVLRARLYEQEQEKQRASIAADRKAQVGSGDRSDRIRTYNFPQSRITDHRIGLTLYKLDAVLNGDLDEIIDALITAEQTEKIRHAGDAPA